MKKVLILLCALFLCFIVGCEEKKDIDEDSILSQALEQIKLDERVSADISLISSLDIQGYSLSIEWSSNNPAISNTGKVNQEESDVNVEMTAVVKLNDKTKSKTINVSVLGKGVDFDSILNELSIDLVLKDNINLPKSLTLDGKNVSIVWEIVKNATDERSSISSDGKVVLPLEEDASFTIVAKVTYNGETKDKAFNVTLLSLKTLCIEASKKVSVPTSTNSDIELPTSVDGVKIDWYTSDSSILTKEGVCSYVPSPKIVTLSAGYAIDYEEDDEVETYYYDVDYKVQVLSFSFDKRVELVKETIKFSDKINGKISLPTSFDYNLSGSWSSSNKAVITDEGVVTYPSEDTVVKLELTLKDLLNENNESKVVFELTVPAILDNEEELEFLNHNIIDYTSKFSSSHLNNLKFNNDGKVVLEDNSLSGTYESRVFYTKKFKSLVGSWSCITSPNATIELEISVYTGGKWSKYFTYGVWGLGKTNTYYNQSDSNTNTKMSVDEIIINNGDATACKYRVTLKRDSTSTASPVLSLVCLALDINDSTYSYPVDISNLPKSVDNEIPKLYQYDVPGIGGSICSATTTTMLLKWKGYSFTDKGYTYEHEYIASLVADPGHNSPTYGNWSYNMAVAGAYGDNAYVARMYSWEEVMYHLATVGPMGASIRSSNGEWGYNTNGHLVIIRGYRISDSGAVTVICNDPAVRGVYYTVTLNQFLQCWRGVSYVMEK